MKFKKFITFLSALALTVVCASCSILKKDSSTSEDSGSASSSITSISPTDSSPAGPVVSDDPNAVGGELKCGISSAHGHEWFHVDEGGTKGLYEFGAVHSGEIEKQWVYFPYVEGKNILSFDIYAARKTYKIHDGAFKLGYNGVVYAYDGETNAWYDAENNKADIEMKDADGDDVDFSSLRYRAGWPVTTFTISGVTTNVEIIFDFDKCDDGGEWIWGTIFGRVQNIYWTVDSTDCSVAGHFWVAANCTTAKTCSKCGETEGEALGHDYSEPTCLALAACSRCGETTGELGDHAYGTLIPKVDETQSTNGFEAHYVCSVCEKYFDEDKNETTYDDLIIDEISSYTVKHYKKGINGALTLVETETIGGEGEVEATPKTYEGYTYAPQFSKATGTAGQGITLELSMVYTKDGVNFIAPKDMNFTKKETDTHISWDATDMTGAELTNGNEDSYVGDVPLSDVRYGTYFSDNEIAWNDGANASKGGGVFEFTYAPENVGGYFFINVYFTNLWLPELWPTHDTTFQIWNGLSELNNQTLKGIYDVNGEETARDEGKWLTYVIYLDETNFPATANEFSVTVSYHLCGIDFFVSDAAFVSKAKFDAWLNGGAACEENGHSWNDATCELPKTCSVCGATEGDALGHVDANLDHVCDRECGKTDVGDHVDGNLDHACDYGCSTAIGDHVDANFDHACDYGCSTAIGDHVDGDDNDHYCDYGCGEYADDGCVDLDPVDGNCDECGAVIAHDCADAENDGDHVCDVCQKPGMSEHTWSEATCEVLATCSECGETKGDYADHAYGDLIPAVPATQDVPGTAAHYVCSVCGKYFNEEMVEVSEEDLVVEWSVLWTVKHWTKEFNGAMTLKDTEEFGTTGEVAATPKTYEGYTYAENLSNATGTAAEGSTLVLNMVYAVEGVNFIAPKDMSFSTSHPDYISWGAQDMTGQQLTFGCADNEQLADIPDSDVRPGTYFSNNTAPWNDGANSAVCGGTLNFTPSAENMGGYLLINMYYSNCWAYTLFRTNLFHVWENGVSKSGSPDARYNVSGAENGVERGKWLTFVIKLDSRFSAGKTISVTFANGCNGNDYYVSDAAFVTEAQYNAWRCSLNGHSFSEATCEAPATCSVCGATEGDALGHVDANLDHVCDNECGKTDVGEHVDANFDHVCDYGCSTAIGEHVDGNLDHACDYGCSTAIGDCVDNDKDHACDYGCGATFGVHEDGEDDNHLCDYGCGQFADEGCVDLDPVDGVCDECGTSVDHDCADAENDGDHNCDICAKPDVTAHTYSEATCETLATCSECGATKGDYADHAYGDLIAEVPATKETNGTAAHYECSVCGKYFNEEKVEVSEEDLVIVWQTLWTVKHWTKEFNGAMTLVETEEFNTSGEVEAVAKTYEGYTYAANFSNATGTTVEDGSLVLNMVYAAEGVNFIAPKDMSFSTSYSDYISWGAQDMKDGNLTDGCEDSIISAIPDEDARLGTYFSNNTAPWNDMTNTHINGGYLYFTPTESDMGGYLLINVYYSNCWSVPVLGINPFHLWSGSYDAGSPDAIFNASGVADSIGSGKWLTFAIKLDSDYAAGTAIQVTFAHGCNGTDYYVSDAAFVTEAQYNAFYGN